MTVDLSTRYLGLELRNPLIVAAAGPLTGNLDMLGRLEAAGASAVVLPSLFEEQIEHEETELSQLYEYHTESFAESLTYFPELDSCNTGPDRYLRHVEDAKQQLRIPVIGSLNGSSQGGWVRFARLIQDAGADALELNIYFVPTDAHMSAADVEQQYVDLAASVRESVSIPLAVKIGPFFSALPHFARRLIDAGVEGLVLFNRFLEPDIDLETLAVTPDLVLSHRHESRLALRWIALLRDQLTVSLAATGGVHRWDDVAKLLLVGADATQMAAALLRNGPNHLAAVIDRLRDWLEENEYASVEQMKGSMSRGNCPDPSTLERANYMQALISYTDRSL